MWYQGKSFFHFVIMHAFYRQTGLHDIVRCALHYMLSHGKNVVREMILLYYFHVCKLMKMNQFCYQTIKCKSMCHVF